MSDAAEVAVEVKNTRPEGPQGPEELDIADLAKAKGRYAILFRKDHKDVAHVEDVEADGTMVYKIMTGPDKDKRYRAKYFAKTIRVYDQENLVLAAME